MDILPAKNSDATDGDEEVKEVRRLSPLNFEADGDFSSEVRAGLYTGWCLKRTRPTSAIRTRVFTGTQRFDLFPR
jgi:hypothetical protein